MLWVVAHYISSADRLVLFGVEVIKRGYTLSRGNMASLRKERSRWEIIHDVLQVAFEEKKTKKTRLMQRACLDWRNFQRYHAFLMEESLLKNCNPEPECYVLTDRGIDLLKKLDDVDWLLKVK